EEGQAAPAEVAGEGQRDVAAGAGELESYHRRAQDMTRVEQTQLGMGRDLHGLVLGHAAARAERLPDPATGRHGRQTVDGLPADDAVNAGIFLLDAGRVAEHQGDEVARGRRAVNGAREALADELGEIAAVVAVGVAEHDRVKGGRLKGEAGAASAGQASLAPNRAAVQEEAITADLDQMHGAGDGLSSTPERYGRILGAARGV